jgi:hypothetical protein
MTGINIQAKKVIAAILLVYFGTAFLSYQAFSEDRVILHPVSETKTKTDDNKKQTPESNFTFDPNAPKTETNPLNGVKLSKEELNFFSKRLPLGVMIENHPDARPQSGLSSADIVYEAVAEGGITRFLAIFWDTAADVTVAPVRSARTYFLDWISEYDGLYAHVGGANCNLTTGSGCANGAPADALGQIERYGIKSLNQYFVGFPTYWRDYERVGRTVATEHTMVSTTEKLWSAAAERGWTGVTEKGSWLETFRPWQFKDEPPREERPESQNIQFGFWENAFADEFRVRWEYHPESNSYRRFLAGNPHLDLNNQEQIQAKNVVILFMTERSANDGYPGNPHLVYGTIGSGDALIFQDGKEIKGSWTKNSRTERTIFSDENGKEISLTRGQTWIEVLPIGNEVVVQ